jgi:hypothetical protein
MVAINIYDEWISTMQYNLHGKVKHTWEHPFGAVLHGDQLIKQGPHKDEPIIQHLFNEECQEIGAKYYSYDMELLFVLITTTSPDGEIAGSSTYDSKGELFQQFEIARPASLAGVLEATVHNSSGIIKERLSIESIANGAGSYTRIYNETNCLIEETTITFDPLLNTRTSISKIPPLFEPRQTNIGYSQPDIHGNWTQKSVLRPDGSITIWERSIVYFS